MMFPSILMSTPFDLLPILRLTGLFILALLVPVINISGQQNISDSLELLLEKHPTRDAEKVDILNELAFSYINLDAEKGLQYAQQAETIATTLNDKPRIARSNSNQGLNYAALGMTDSANLAYDKAAETHREAGNPTGEGSVLHNKGLLFSSRGMHADALQCHKSALQIFSELDDTFRMAISYNSLGVNYMQMQQYLPAMENFLKSLRLYEELNNTYMQGMLLSNIGIIHKNLNDFEQAMDFQQRALDKYESSNDLYYIGKVYGNIGILYDLMHRPEDALKAYKIALHFADSTGNIFGQGSSFANKGIIYLQQEKYKEAMENFNNALARFEAIGDERNKIVALTQIAQVYAKAPSEILKLYQVDPQNRAVETLKLLDLCIKMAVELDDLPSQVNAWKLRTELLESEKRFDEAFVSLKTFHLLNDSLRAANDITEVSRLQMQYEYESKEARLEAEHQLQQALTLARLEREKMYRQFFLIAALLLIVGGSLMFYFYKTRRDAELLQQKLNYNHKVLELETKALRSQMNPHFLFNSLNAIADYVDKNDPETASLFLTRFAGLMRTVLENSEHREIRLSEELEALKRYVELEQLRLKKPIELEIEVEDQLDAETISLPPLLLQPFAENAIWHGIAPSDSPGHIKISFLKKDNYLQCLIHDNGIGRSSNQNGNKYQNKTSLGVKITRARVELYNVAGINNIGVFYEEVSSGTCVKVNLPFQSVET